MTQPEHATPLFADFKPLSRQEWEEKIKKDLKGEDPASLQSGTYEGITIKPFYTAEDVASLPQHQALPGQFPYVRGNSTEPNHCQNMVVVLVGTDSRQAIDTAAQALAGGADGVHFKIDEPAAFDAAYLAAQLDLTRNTICYSVPDQAKVLLENIFQALHQQQQSPHGLKGFIQIHQPEIAEISRPAAYQLEELVELTKDAVDFYGITVHGAQFGNRGATAIQELAFTLSLAVQYVDQLSARGIPLSTIFRNLQLTVSTGTNYFMEIAKLRALRWLWSGIVKTAEEAPELAGRLRIHAASASWFMTTFDPHTNILRTTTEAMAAMLGGSDSVSLLPFDFTFKQHNPFSARIVRNIPLILRHEAYLNQVLDPAAGSYYVESLTLELAQKAWALFQQLETMGGFDGALKSGYLINELISTAQAKFQAFAAGKEVLVGSNKFSNRQEKIDYDGEALLQSRYFDTSRASYPFEVMRLAALLHYQKKQARPKAIIAIVGHDIQEHIHAAFAKEFFECGDFDTQILHFESVSAALEKLLFTDCRIIVLASAESDYERFSDHFLKALRNHKGRPDLILAAAPEEMKSMLEQTGFDGYLFQNCDVRQIITRIHERLLAV